MSKDGKKPLGDSSVFQKGRKGAMCYLRTVIVTAAVYWGFNSELCLR